MELFQPTHLLVLAVIALVLFFGWKQMPDMARSLGRSLRVFKTEIKGLTEDDKTRTTASQQHAAPAALEARPAQAELKKTVPAAAQTQPAVVRQSPRPRPTNLPGS